MSPLAPQPSTLPRNFACRPPVWQESWRQQLERKGPFMRKCNRSGTCGPQRSELSRREFIGLMGAGTTALLTAPAWGAFELSPGELAQGRRAHQEEACR